MAVSDELKELNGIWKEVMRSFTDELSISTIDLWFAPLELTAFENNTIHFGSNEKVGNIHTWRR